MIKLSVLYPFIEGSKFDWDYYLNEHIPLSQKLQGKFMKEVTVDKGLHAGLPDSNPPYTAICHFFYDSYDDFEKAFFPNAKALQEDIPNYTDIQPLILFSEVVFPK
jgi:uncharacterized protein (TIGR02118 family)